MSSAQLTHHPRLTVVGSRVFVDYQHEGATRAGGKFCAPFQDVRSLKYRRIVTGGGDDSASYDRNYTANWNKAIDVLPGEHITSGSLLYAGQFSQLGIARRYRIFLSHSTPHRQHFLELAYCCVGSA